MTKLRHVRLTEEQRETLRTLGGGSMRDGASELANRLKLRLQKRDRA